MANRRSRKTSTAVAKPEKGAPPAVAAEFERDAGAGFENADRDSYAIPFLVVLQKNSPQCDEDSDAYVNKAKPGMFFNTATGELYDGAKGVLLVPAHYSRQLVEWTPRDQGGGFRGAHDPDSIDMAKLSRDDSGRFVLDNGNYLADTRYHFCVQLTDDGPRTIVFALTSTQIKKSRQWMTKMSMIKLVGKGGEKFTPPTFSHVYRVTTVNESNEKGSWKGVDIELDHTIGKDEIGLYMAAKEFKKQIESGQARVEEPVREDDDNEPF